MNKMIDWEYRYELDFIRFPVLIHRAQRKVIDLIIGGSYAAMSSLYNKGWPGGKTDRFSPEDFKCESCGELFIKEGNRQKYCKSPICQAERNNRKAQAYYLRKKSSIHNPTEN